MGRPCSLRVPILCADRAQFLSPSRQSKFSSSSDRNDLKIKLPGHVDVNKFSMEEGKNVHECKNNRIMVVVDSSREAKGALQWALSHTVHGQDTISLLYVIKQAKEGEDPKRELYLKAYRVLHSMQNICRLRRPGVQVEVSMVEGKEKGPTIVKEAKRQRVSLLVLGQKKRPMLWQRLLRIWWRRRVWNEVVEYCVQNANSMTIAVRRKGGKHGGYLITTKRHRNFWLLA